MRKVIAVRVKKGGEIHDCPKDPAGWRCGACRFGMVRAREGSACTKCKAKVVEIKYAPSGLGPDPGEIR